MNFFRNTALCLPLALSVLASGQTAGSGGSSSQPAPQAPSVESSEIWMSIGNLSSLANNPSDWEISSQQIRVVKFYISEIEAKSAQDLYNITQLLESKNIKIAIEMAGLAKGTWNLGTQSAAQSVNMDRSAIAKLTGPVQFDPNDPTKLSSTSGAGAYISYLIFDGPVRRVVWPNGQDPTGQPVFHTIDTATDEVIQAMNIWSTILPGVQFVVLSNFPNWGWKNTPAYFDFGLPPSSLGWGDYYEVFDKITRKAANAGVAFTGFTIDNPYDYAIGVHSSNQVPVIAGIDWIARLLDIEAEVHARGLELHHIYNSESGGMSSNLDFMNETLDYIDLYLAAGGQPDASVIQSWYDYPDTNTLTPETQEGTMTNLILQATPKLGPFILTP